MNFIARNLGWILLLLFFIFMLFLISTNSPEKQNINSLMSGAKVTSSGAKLGELDKLMEKIDAEEGEGTKNEEKIVSAKNQEDDSDEEKKELMSSKETKRSLWARLFGKKDTEKQDDTDSGLKNTEEKEKNTDTSDTEKTKQTVQASSGNTSLKNDLIIKKPSSKTVISNSQNVNLVKNTKNSTAHSTVKNTYGLPNNFIFPGKNLTTKVGKSYEVGVKSLKLNNKSFTKNLGYMMKGDTVKQLAPANARGCFLAEVTKATISANQGKKGYVCKKWLSNISSSSEVKTPLEPQKENTSEGFLDSNFQEGIGNTFIGKKDHSFYNVDVQKGDTFEQFTEKDENGCMKFMVSCSGVENAIGKIVSICQ